MVKEQWWSFLQVLVRKYNSSATSAVSAILEVSLPKGCVLAQSIIQMVYALSELQGHTQEQAVKGAFARLKEDKEFLPQVISLVVARFDSITSSLVQVQRMGVGNDGLVNLARKNILESKDPLLKEAYQALLRVGKQIKQSGAASNTDPTKANETNNLIASSKSPAVNSPEAQNNSHQKQSNDQNFFQPGDVIGAQDWKLVELLGRGGMGSVWKAKNHFDEMGALKLMLPHLVSNDSLIRRFQLEIRAIKKIRHANVVELSDWGRDRANQKERWYFVTDFIAGKPLSKILQEKGKLSHQETKEIFLQLADGLAAAHKEGVIHRDIKPGNIMIRPDGTPVIIDFGIARQLEDPSMTQTHERVLTLQFASPEQLYGEPVSPHSDVFSLAATMSFALHPDPKRQRPQFEPDKSPEAFHWILERSLNYKPENRPEDMKEFAEMLSQIEFDNGVIVNFPRKPQQDSMSGYPVHAAVLQPGMQSIQAIDVSGGLKQVQQTHKQASGIKLNTVNHGTSAVATHGNDSPSALKNLSNEVYHYHGPSGQKKLPLAEIVEFVKTAPKERHLVWKKGWSEWKPWYKVSHLKEYVQALKETQSQMLVNQNALTLSPFSKHTVSIMGVNHDMVAVPPGSFWMGNSNIDAESDEKPRHRVHLSRGFLMSTLPMTQDFFVAVSGHNPSQFKYDNHPVERISWYDAIRWCNQLSEQDQLSPVYDIQDNQGKLTVVWNAMNDGYRLPTEAEWEYAARAGSNFTYAGSNRPDEVAWFGASRRREGQKTYAVGGKKPNGWGIFDMSGNTWEWCWGDLREYSSKDVHDPIGSTDTEYRICRGGSNYLDARQTRCSYRMRYATSYRSLYVGFRIVRTLG